MLAFMELHRINGILRAIQVDGIKIRQSHKDLIRRNAETRPVDAPALPFPAIILQRKNASRLLDDRLILLRHQRQRTVHRQLKLVSRRKSYQRIAKHPLGVAFRRKYLVDKYAFTSGKVLVNTVHRLLEFVFSERQPIVHILVGHARRGNPLQNRNKTENVRIGPCAAFGMEQLA